MEHILNNMTADTYLINRGNVDPQVFYMKLFGKFPHNLYLSGFDYEKGYAMIQREYADQIATEFHKYDVDCRTRKEEKIRTVMVLKNNIILELGNDFCDIFYGDEARENTEILKKKLLEIKVRKRKTNQEINIVAQGEYELELMPMEVKRTRLDIDMHYEDELKEVDAIIQKRLNKKQDKGIVLLHGAPGTGKTTYIRYLIGKIKKKVLFIPPNLAGQITNPSLMKLLIDNPESVLIIEDAENVIMQRRAGEDSSVSNLLNIADGLMSDFLNVQIICTFNSPLSKVDDALLRKGRLIAKYEFGKLSIPKAQKLSDSLGHHSAIMHPMSLAEIFNPNEKVYVEPRALIGFRRSAIGTA